MAGNLEIIRTILYWNVWEIVIVKVVNILNVLVANKNINMYVTAGSVSIQDALLSILKWCTCYHVIYTEMMYMLPCYKLFIHVTASCYLATQLYLLYFVSYLSTIQKCQHFHQCTNSTFFQTPPPSPPSVQTNIFAFQNMSFLHNIYYATTEINPSFKPIWYVTNDSFG